MTATSPARSKRIALLTAGTILLAVAGGAGASHTPSPAKIIHPIIIWASACTHSPPRDDARVDGASDRPDRCRIVEEPAAD
jgi:hypothetical protein